MIANISDIQHFSLGDGEGIRTTVFFKGCNLHCPWCHNPETISPKPQILRYNNSLHKRQCGKLIPVDEIFKQIMLDRDFYVESGGGVTISGGESMLQADAARELAELLCKEHIHVIMDTAGDVPYTEFEKVNPFIALYFYDVKACNEEDYRRVIGGDFSRIYGNMKRLVAVGKKVRARVPLIPGFNTADSYSERICECLLLAGIEEVDLLPFHRLGEAKYKALGKNYAYRANPPMSFEEADNIADIYRKYFCVRIEK